MKKNIKKIIIFLCALVLIGSFIEKSLKKPKNVEWNTMGIENIKSMPNYYDVILSGTSMTLTNINVEELYLKYGIAGMSIGKPEQMVFLSYYELKNVLKYQSPKVVLFDAQALFYSEDLQKKHIADNEEYYVHFTLDDINDLKIKYEAVKQVKELNSSSTYADYFWGMFHNHSNWEEITRQNFKNEIGKDILLGNKNLLDVLENVDNISYISKDDNTNIKEDIPEINKKYLKKIGDLCKEKNVELVIVRSCGSRNWSWEQYNAVADLANELEVNYLDLAIEEEEIGFNWKTDTYDGNHHNIKGAKKWTDFVGKYLVENYDFTDKRKDSKYKEYEEQKQVYEEFLLAQDIKISLLEATNLNQYLDTLLNMEKKDSTIFISVYDEASTSLSDVSQNYLYALGMEKDLRNDYRYSYYSVVDDGKLIAEAHSESVIETSGLLNNGSKFEISSGGLLSGSASSIKIDGVEYGQNGRGINIVVYNKKIGQVLNSVYFDTFAYDNAPTSRMVDGMIQKESDMNVCKTDRE